MTNATSTVKDGYGEATCPKCGNKAIDNTDDCAECEEIGNYMTRKDYHCHACGTADPTKFDGARVPIYCFDSDMAWAFSERRERHG